MSQQIPMQFQRSQSGYDTDGLQQLQNELQQEDFVLQRLNSEEERNHRQKMRQIFRSVSIFLYLIYYTSIDVNFFYGTQKIKAKKNYC